MAPNDGQWSDEELRILLMLYRCCLSEGQLADCKDVVAEIWSKIFPNWTWTSSSLEQIARVGNITDETRDAALLWRQFQDRYKLELASAELWTEIERPNLRRQDEYEEEDFKKFTEAGDAIFQACKTNDIRQKFKRCSNSLRRYFFPKNWPSAEALGMRDWAKAGEDVPDPYEVQSPQRSESEGEDTRSDDSDSEGGIRVQGRTQYPSGEAQEIDWALRQVEEAQLREAIEASRADEQSEHKSDYSMDEESSDAEDEGMTRERLILFDRAIMAVAIRVFPNRYAGFADFDVVLAGINGHLAAIGEQRFKQQEADMVLTIMHQQHIIHYHNGTVRPLRVRPNDQNRPPQQSVQRQARTPQFEPAEMRECDDEMMPTGVRTSQDHVRTRAGLRAPSPEGEDMEKGDDAVDLDDHDFGTLEESEDGDAEMEA